MPDIHLTISELNKVQPTITHADHPDGAVDCGSEVAVWLSQYITGNDNSNRLVFYPDIESIQGHRNKHLKLQETGYVVRFDVKINFGRSCGFILA